jgi:hypothetical protein
MRTPRTRTAGSIIDLILRQVTRYPFYNTSNYTLGSLGSTKTRQNLQDYVARFSDNARIIFEQFDFTNTLVRLDKAGLLFRLCKTSPDRSASGRRARSRDEQPVRAPDPPLRRRGE